MSRRVVVVGGGIAGVSAAAELAAEIVPAGGTVTLLEAEVALAHHTTGRSAAMFLPGYGNAVVRALTAAGHDDLLALGEEMEAPTLSPKPMLWVADDEVLDHLDAIASGNDVLEPIDTAGALARCPVLRPERVAAGLADVYPVEQKRVTLSMSATEVERVQHALRTLAVDQQEVLILRFGQMLNLEATADSMGKSVSAIKSLQFRAINSLRRALHIAEGEAVHGESWID